MGRLHEFVQTDLYAGALRGFWDETACTCAKMPPSVLVAVVRGMVTRLRVMSL